VADDLSSFLLARIAEDDFVAYSCSREEELFGSLAEGALAQDDKRLTHAARWRPDAVRAHCAARRRIVELHTNAETPTICPACHYEAGYDTLPELAPCPTLRLLALPYADYPGYRQEWKP
jgi:hypothetical protein